MSLSCIPYDTVRALSDLRANSCWILCRPEASSSQLAAPKRPEPSTQAQSEGLRAPQLPRRRPLTRTVTQKFDRSRSYRKVEPGQGGRASRGGPGVTDSQSSLQGSLDEDDQGEPEATVQEKQENIPTASTASMDEAPQASIMAKPTRRYLMTQLLRCTANAMFRSAQITSAHLYIRTG